MGVRGAHVTVGRRGVTRTVGLPGTGVYWTDRGGRHTGVHSGQHFVPANPAAQPNHSATVGCLLTMIAALLVFLWWAR